MVGFAETRPHYGGTLRVELHDSFETADPPQTGPGMASLARAFNIVTWEGGHRAVFAADENAAGGRPFVDSVEIQLARPLRDQSIDLELGRTDIVELGPNEIRRQQPGRKTWQSQPVRVVALVFSRRVEDVRVREALALAVDRSAILDGALAAARGNLRRAVAAVALRLRVSVSSTLRFAARTRVGGRRAPT